MGSGDEVVLVLASIHGSEPAGTPLLEQLFEHLTAHPELLNGRTLIAVPVVNPDGYAKRRRLNSNGVDLNRNFPAKNRQERRLHGAKGLSESESRALAEDQDAFFGCCDARYWLLQACRLLACNGDGSGSGSGRWVGGGTSQSIVVS